MWYVLGYMSLKIAFVHVLAEAALPPIRKGRLLKTLEIKVSRLASGRSNLAKRQVAARNGIGPR